MHATTLLTTLTSLTLALANPLAAPAPAPTPTHPGAVITPAPLLPRAAANLISPHHQHQPALAGRALNRSQFSSCTSKLASLANAYPTPAPSLSSWLEDQAGGHLQLTDITQINLSLTTLCSAVLPLTAPPALSAEYDRYRSQTSSWGSSAASEAERLEKECGTVVGAVVELLTMSDLGSCTKAVEGLVDVVTRSGNGVAAARETGLVAAAAAAAVGVAVGVAGVVAL